MCVRLCLCVCVYVCGFRIWGLGFTFANFACSIDHAEVRNFVTSSCIFCFFSLDWGQTLSLLERQTGPSVSLCLSLSLSLSSCWAPCVNSCASRVTQGCTHTGNRHSRARTRAHTHTSGSWNDFALATIFSKNSVDRRGRERECE